MRNLSDRELSESELSVLRKGPNFSITPVRKPTAEIITATESVIKHGNISHAEAETLRCKVSNILCNSKLPPSNVTKEERAAISDLSKDNSIAIVPADKGRCMVVLNKEDYDSKCQDLLKDTKTYKKIGYNPTSGYRKKVVDYLDRLYFAEKVIDEKLYYKLKPASEPTVPAFYGLPKIHKPDPVPVRPIVSACGSVTYDIAKYAAEILSPLVGKTVHHIKNSKEFHQKVTQLVLEDDEIITSYDVKALFTCIPPKDALEIARQYLENDTTLSQRTPLSVDQVCELIRLCLETTYFSYGGTFYRQIHGCAMGSPVSPILVNLYMEKFEQRALAEYTGIPPRIWVRYVDDVWSNPKQSQEGQFFLHINKVDKYIEFTQEPMKEPEKQLPYLDSLTHVESDNTISTRVYRKPTHTDQYLQFDSHHALAHKLGVIRTLNYRADTIVSDPEEVRKEKEYIKTALGRCGYPDWAFHKANKPQRDTQAAPERVGGSGGKPRRISIPYVEGLSDRLRKVFRQHSIQTSTKPVNSLRQALVHVKDKTPHEKRSHLVYGLKCPHSDCDRTYVGETQQAIKKRASQHRRPTPGDQPDSAIYSHLQESGHSFSDSDLVILDREDRWFERGVRESIYERVEKPSLNKPGGLRFNLSHVWDRTLEDIPSRLLKL